MNGSEILRNLSIQLHASNSKLTALICVQGGGAKGGWQGGLLEELLASSIKIDPIAAIGSSAGAINCVLINSKLQSGHANVFSNYWLKIPRHRVCNLCFLIIASLCNLPVTFLRLLPYLCHPASRRRLPGIVPYYALRWVLTRDLPPDCPAKIHTYMYTTDIDKDTPPPVIDDQNLASFCWEPNTTLAQVLLDGANGDITISNAVTMSSCLPYVTPAKLNGRNVADGGIYSNLPLDVVLSHGALGAKTIFFVLATPVSELKPSNEFIDWRTLVLLRRLKAEQLLAERHFRQRRSGVCPAHTASPIFLIQPCRPLSSGRLAGFLCQRLMKRDFASGMKLGQHISSEIQRLCNGDASLMGSFLLTSLRLPHAQKQRPPLRQFWVQFVNRRWSSVGWPSS